MKKKIKILCNGIIQKGNKFLFLKRSSKEIDDPGEWELPGGFIEFGEDPTKGVIREIKEEIGLDVEIVSIYRILSKEYEKPGKKIHLIRIIYLFKTSSEKVKLNEEEHEDYRWVKKEEIKDLKMSDYLKNIFINICRG